MREVKNFNLTALVFYLAFVLIFSAKCFGSGFLIPEMGTKATSLGVSFVANADDPSAIAINPAGLTQASGYNFMISPLLVMIDSEYIRPQLPADIGKPAPTDIKSEESLVPYLGFTTNLGIEKLGVGFGIYSPFGLSSVWPDNGAQRFTNVEVSLKSIYFSPSVAYEVFDGFSIGLSASFIQVFGRIERKMDLYGNYPNKVDEPGYSFKMNGDGTGFGGQIGLLFKRNKFSVGLTYSPPVTITIEGDASLPELANFTHGIFSGKDKGSMDLNLPQIAKVGFLYRTNEKLFFEVDVNWVGWSVFDEYTLDFENSPPKPGTQPTFPSDSRQIREWEDALAFRIGMEYNLKENVWLRLGYLYDQTSIPDSRMSTQIPDSNKHGLAIGAGYKIKNNFILDWAFMHLFYEDRIINNSAYPYDENPEKPDPDLSTNGEYSTDIDLVSISLTYSF